LIATDLADGQITARRGFDRVKRPCRNFSFGGSVEVAIEPNRAALAKGTFRDRHGRGAGCGGRGQVGRRATKAVDGQIGRNWRARATSDPASGNRGRGHHHGYDFGRIKRPIELGR
jgi:hypothetical protein